MACKQSTPVIPKCCLLAEMAKPEVNLQKYAVKQKLDVHDKIWIAVIQTEASFVS